MGCAESQDDAPILFRNAARRAKTIRDLGNRPSWRQEFLQFLLAE
jgi:hypothetical protein